MTIQRRPLEDLRVPQAVSPVASPANTYHRPNIAQPELAPITDLAPLSQTLQKFLLSKQEQSSRQAATAAEAFFADPAHQADVLGLQAPPEDGEAAAKALKRRFRRLAEDGTIPEAAQPAFQVRFAELAAARVAAQYRNRLQSKVNAAAALVDPQTGLPSQSPDVQAIKDEAWADLAGNAAVVDYFGSRIASPAKLAADEEFDAAVARVRGQEMEREARAWQADDVAVQVAQTLREGGDVAELSQRLQDQVGDVFVQPRALVLQGVELAAGRLAHGTPESPGDPDDALELLDRVAGSLKVDGLTLAQDPETAARLDHLREAYEQEAGERDARQVRALAARQALAAARVRERALSAFVDAQRAGESLGAVEQSIGKELESLPDEERGAAFEALRALRQSVEGSRSSDPDALREVQALMARGDFETASTALTAGLEGGTLEASDVLALQDDVTRRSRQRDVLDGNRQFREGLGVLSRARESLQGFTGDVAREADGLFEDALLRFTQAAEEAVDPNGIVDSEKVRQAAQAARSELDAFAAQKSQQRQEVYSQVRERAARLTDSADLLQQAILEGRITPEERDQLRGISLQATDRRRALLEQTRAGIGEAVLSSPVLADAGLVDITSGRPTASGLSVIEAQERAVRDQMDAWLDENAAQIPAERLQSAFSARLRVVRDEQLAGFRELSPEQLRQRFGLSAAGTTRQVSQAATAERRADADRVGVLIRSGAKDVYPEDLRVEGVPGRAYQTYSQVRRGKVSQAAGAVALHAQAAAEQDPARRREITRLGLLTPEVVLAGGKARVFLPEDVRQDADRRLRGLLARQAGAGAIERVKALLTPVEVDLSDAVIDPWTTPLFRSRAELRAFGDGPDLPRLLERLGLESSDAPDWLGQQMLLTPQ